MPDNLGSNPFLGTGVGSENGHAFETISGNGIGDWFSGEDHFAHNEAVAAWARESASAREAREYETFLANTQMQRKVADYKAAGFSPLAALEGSGMNYSPTVSAASSSAAARGSNSTGSVLAAIIAAVAMIASKGISAAVSAKGARTASNTLKELTAIEKLGNRLKPGHHWIDYLD